MAQIDPQVLARMIQQRQARGRMMQQAMQGQAQPAPQLDQQQQAARQALLQAPQQGASQAPPEMQALNDRMMQEMRVRQNMLSPEQQQQQAVMRQQLANGQGVPQQPQPQNGKGGLQGVGNMVPMGSQQAAALQQAQPQTGKGAAMRQNLNMQPMR